MNRKNWVWFGVAAAVAAPVIACSSDFSTCETSRSCPAGGGGGISGGSGGGAKGSTAGAQNVGEAGDESANAGSGDEVGRGGGRQSGPEADAGAGGAPDESPVLFGACSMKGQVACADHASAQRLGCDGVKWQAASTCADGELCDSSTGKCVITVKECALAKPGQVVCREDTLLTCGPDLVTVEEGDKCSGLCKDGKCQAATCGDGKVQPGEDCDDPAATASGACVKCKAAACGDGVVYPGHEQCDDGNTKSGDGCSASCKAEPVALALGDSYTCALSSTGVVKCWGKNEHGVLGTGQPDVLGDEPGEVGKLKPVDLGTGRTAKAIAGASDNICVLLDDGSMKCWGNNDHGQLGTGDNSDRGDGPGEMGDALLPIALGAGRTTRAISTNYAHTCAVLDNGQLKCWGENGFGQLGQDDADDRHAPPTNPVPVPGKVANVSAGYAGVCALMESGAARCWGYPGYLGNSMDTQLGGGPGVGDYPGEIEGLPTLNLAGHALKVIVSQSRAQCGILDNDLLKCWGDGTSENLGMPAGVYGRSPDELAALAPLDFGVGKTVKSVVASDAHACVLLTVGEVKCFGYNSGGVLGTGDEVQYPLGNTPLATFKAVNLGKPAVQIGTGVSHSCAILNDGTLKCWGANDSGQLGLGDQRTRGNSGGKLSDDVTVPISF